MATLAGSEPTRMASAGGQLRALNRLRAEALGDLAIGIDDSLSGEIDGPEWSVSGRRTAGPFVAIGGIADMNGRIDVVPNTTEASRKVGMRTRQQTYGTRGTAVRRDVLLT